MKKGPSSPGTVLTMAGLFVVGLLLMISGMLVLIAVSIIRKYSRRELCEKERLKLIYSDKVVVKC